MRSSASYLVIGLFGAAMAWVAQMLGSEIIASHACYPQGEPLSAPLWPRLHSALAALSLVCFATAAFSARVAWRSWQRAREKTGGGREYFLALVGLYSSGLFVIAVLFTACALWLVSPC